LPRDDGKFFRTGKGIIRLIRFARNFKQDIRYWEKRGIPTLISTPCNIPYEIFSSARTYNRFIMDIHHHPEKVTAAMDAVLPATIDTVKKGAKFLGVPRAFVSCERGSGDSISPKYFENFYFPWLKRLVDALVKENITPLLHLDGNWDRNLPYLKELPQGKCILDLDSATNIFKAKEILGDHMCIMGDVPASLLTLGTPEDVETYCKKLIDEVGKGGGFILSSGCTVPYNAKFENLKAMIHTGKTYG
jgi:uroporphyrinogen-III decarboxylase